MDATRRELILQRWNVIQNELLPELRNEVGALTPKLEKLIHVLEWVRIEEFTQSTWCGVGRPPHERAWLANAFVAKAVLGLTSTAGLIERLTIDRALRRICGFALCQKLPSEATFSRAFEEFAQGRVAERVHETPIKEHLGGELIGHISRDGTAIAARERPAKAAGVAATGVLAAQAVIFPAAPVTVETSAPAPARRANAGAPGAARYGLRPRNRRSNASRAWRRCSRRSPQHATVAPSATRKATRREDRICPR
jgi:hypothetical protein